jgi:3-(3-hydroxy-phenyl)propionate hydroxylase
MSQDAGEPDADVAIVGGGPTGLTLACFLGAYGVRTVLLEQSPATTDETRAVSVLPDGQRTLQALGLARAFFAGALTGMNAQWLDGRGRPLLSADMSHSDYAPSGLAAMLQPELEQLLHAHAAASPSVTLRFGCRVTGVSQDAAGANVTIGGSSGRSKVRARYVVGCDGGQSIVREAAGIPLEGETMPNPWLTVDMIDPFEHAGPPIQQICDPKRPAYTMRMPQQRRRWEWMLRPGERTEAMLDDDVIAQLLPPHVDRTAIRILRKRVYWFRALTATRLREGRLLLAGDAAHMMPPNAGEGMNSGLRDARNLAWKLALVLHAGAAQDLLDSYEQERLADARRVVALSLRVARMVSVAHPLKALLRDAFLRIATRLPAPSSAAAVPRLPASSAWVSNTPHAGEQMVQARASLAADAAWSDDRLGPGFAWLCTAPQLLQALQCPELERVCGLTRWRLAPAAAAGGNSAEDPGPTDPDTLLDPTGTLARWLDDRALAAVLLRPDRHIALSIPRGAQAIPSNVPGWLR